jgi:glycosyltransferase involved in cell wall biosynthesis
MKVLKLWDGDYPWDIRVEKFCNALIEAGDEVHLVCRNLARKPREELYKGIHLHRLPFLPKWLGSLNAAFTFPAFFSPVWLYCLYRNVRKHRCDVIVIRDLPMAPAGILIGRLTGRPVIMDMAECYPEMLKSRWQHQKPKLIDHVVRNPAFAAIVEKWSVRALDAIIVVVQEARDRMIRMGADPSRVFIVTNTPEKKRFDEAAQAAVASVAADKPVELIYVGLVNASRGLDTVIDAVELHAKAGGKLLLRVVGTGAQSAYLDRTVKERGLTELVRFEGWVENTKVPDMVARADAGLVPHHSTSHWQNTIPNKLFDYMATGKPVIATNIPPVARVVSSEKCGLLFNDYDAAGLAAIFRQLEDRNLVRTMGENGKRAVAERYNWDAEKPALRQALRRVTEGASSEPVRKAS